MSAKKPALPDLASAQRNPLVFYRATKDFIETMSGRRGERIAVLTARSTATDVVNTVNALLGAVQDVDTQPLQGGAVLFSTSGGVPGPAGALDTETTTARSAVITTAQTTVGAFPVAGGSVAAGARYEFSAELLVTNSTTASTMTAVVSVGATAVATHTQALGTTARTDATLIVTGVIHFQSAVSADGHVRSFTSAPSAHDALTGTGSTPATVATAVDTDVNLRLNTDSATSTLTVKSLRIAKTG